MINSELNRLGLPQLYPALGRILENFAGFPIEEEADPVRQLLAFLFELDPPVSAYRICLYVSRLDVFSYRAFVKLGEQREPVYWNPLEVSYSDFFPERTKVVIQAENEYPAPDIIVHYCQSHGI